MPTLEVLEQDRIRLKCVVGPGRVVLGRSDAADVWLDGETVSRRHAVLDPRSDGWWLNDRSLHGTLVNGEAVRQQRLVDGDLIVIGPNRMRFVDRGRSERATTTRQLRPIVHEEPVEVTEGIVTVARAEIRFTRGPREGEQVMLDGPRHRLGGTDADDVHLIGLPARAAELQVVRGRAMITPGSASTRVGGRTVPATMPVFESEEVELGRHGFIITTTFRAVTDTRKRFGELVGTTPIMESLFGVLSRVAAHDHPVLLIGESGTGKELAAQALHDEGTRASMPFVPVNCAALPDTLVESALFGHIKGAFTGAVSDQDGAFQRADGGTLFLDEVGELKLEAQAKLLRALESREVRKVGARDTEYPDVRVVAATNRDLGKMVGEGSFRRDLFFRLSVLSVRMPSLHEHIEDLPTIAEALVRRHLPGATLSPGALARLREHRWPGNVRELRNVLTRAYVLGGNHILPEALTFNALETGASVRKSGGWVGEPVQADRAQIEAALAEAQGNKSKAARMLGIPRSSLLYRLKKYGI